MSLPPLTPFFLGHASIKKNRSLMQTYAGGETDVITGNAEAPNLNWIGIIHAELHPEEDCRSLSEVLWSDQR